jgi:hypothetical protein
MEPQIPATLFTAYCKGLVRIRQLYGGAIYSTGKSDVYSVVSVSARCNSPIFTSQYSERSTVARSLSGDMLLTASTDSGFRCAKAARSAPNGGVNAGRAG